MTGMNHAEVAGSLLRPRYLPTGEMDMPRQLTSGAMRSGC
jgi:hypothetical protein